MRITCATDTKSTTGDRDRDKDNAVHVAHAQFLARKFDWPGLMSQPSACLASVTFASIFVRLPSPFVHDLEL